MTTPNDSPPATRPTLVPQAFAAEPQESDARIEPARVEPEPIETPETPVRRATTPPGGTPSLPVAAIDLWRDRIRTALDRFIYLGGLAAIVALRLRDKLDVGAVVAILLVCGVRPHTILDAIFQRGGAVRTGAGAALPVAGALSWHRFFGSVLALALVVNGVAVALPLVR